MRYSRAMSCADFALVPAGGRRSTRSRAGYFSRYVQFEAPPVYCVTSGSPSSVGSIVRSHRSTAATSSASPLRTGPLERDAVLQELDAGDERAVHLVRPVRDPEAP